MDPPCDIQSGTGNLLILGRQRKACHVGGTPSSLSPTPPLLGFCREEAQTHCSPGCCLQSHARNHDRSVMASSGASPTSLQNRFWTGLLAKKVVCRLMFGSAGAASEDVRADRLIHFDLSSYLRLLCANAPSV